MLRQTSEPVSPGSFEDRIHRENRRLLALVAAVVVLVTAVTVVALGTTAEASSTPHPDEIAFVRNGDIHFVRADGSGARNVTRSKALEYAPAWSRDGRRLAYVGYRDGDAEIYVADADARNPVRITANRVEDLAPAWSPDGTRIAFTSNRSGEYEIYVMDADGANVRRLTHDSVPGYGSYSPAWSPDGARIVFQSAARTPENAELYSIAPDGSRLRRLTHTVGDVETLGDDSFASWSPDGKRIVFMSNRRGGGALWVMRPDGRGQRMLLNFPDSDDWTPDFSPDGRTIAFTRLYARKRDEIWTVRADGKGARRVAAGSDPAWRPAP